MLQKAAARALVQGTSLDRVEAISCKIQDWTIFSSSILFGWQGFNLSRKLYVDYFRAAGLRRDSDACRKDVVAK
jgi:hypothetical protein